jgi:hypothetical protein
MAGEEQNEQQPVEQAGNIVARPSNARGGDRSHRGRSWLRWSGRRAPTDIEAKRLELLREVLPRLSRVAYLASKDDRDWQSPVGHSLQAAAQALGVMLVLAEHTSQQVTEAFAFFSGRGLAIQRHASGIDSVP